MFFTQLLANMWQKDGTVTLQLKWEIFL